MRLFITLADLDSDFDSERIMSLPDVNIVKLRETVQNFFTRVSYED